MVHLGADREGFLAIDSLKRANVNVSYIDIEYNKSTNIINIIVPNSELNDNNVIHSWYSPITNKLTMIFEENLISELPEELQNNEIYLILDKFFPINLEFLNSIKSKKVCLDIRHIHFFEHFTKQYITNFFKNADYMQLNTSTLELLFERLNINSKKELFEMLDLELLVLTKGKESAIFLYRNNEGEVVSISKTPEVIVDSLDTSRAGDAFFSTVVREYAYAESINEEFIDKIFKLANSASRDILSQVGSRK